VDHVAGNGVFGDAGAMIVAHRHVRDWIHTENLRLMGPQITPAQKTLTEAFVAPTVGYDQSLTLYLGSRQIQVLSLPGHTGGDSIVVVPDSKIVFGGDLLFHNMLPTLVDASTQAWIDTLDLLLTRHADHTFVPGHGDVGKAQDVAAFREYLMRLRRLVTEAQAQGQSGDAVAAAVMPALKEKYGHMEFFDGIAKQNVLETDAELHGRKRVPPVH
jgi:cyclase